MPSLASGAIKPGAIKLCALVWRRPGLTHEEFKQYYEDIHLPLVTRLLPFHVEHRRTYVRPDGYGHEDAHGPTRGAQFDALTEVWYPNQAALDRMSATLDDPEVAALMAQDEEKFVDRARTIFFLGEEHQALFGDGR